MQRRAMLGLALSLPVAAASAQESAPLWPAWNEFHRGFVQADGRVVDRTFEFKSTSEGQSYALFFALVANQRARFDILLAWTDNNLAAGRLGQRLPAWHWGQRKNGSWGVKDENSASDADLWIAYVLLEAARLWQAPAYADLGRRLLDQIARHEVVQAGASGALLLPGAFGFSLPGGRYRINPSYLPPFMFGRLATLDPRGPWQAIWDAYVPMQSRAFAAGIAPDLFVVDSAGRVMADTEAPPSASYDAIRVYLWAGLSGGSGLPLARQLAPFAALTRRLGRPPEKVDPVSGQAVANEFSPIGFSGAVLPFLAALDERTALQRQRERISAASQTPAGGEPRHYYDQVLLLFGQGWLDGHYRFDGEGRLVPRWAA